MDFVPRGAGIEILDIHFSKCDSRILSIKFSLAAAGICFASIAQQTNPLVVVCHWWPGLFSIHGIYAVVVPIFCWICISYLFDLRYQWFGWVYLCHNLQQILALFGRHQTKFQTDTSRCDLPRLVPSSAETLPATIDVAPIAVLRNGGHGLWKETFGAVRTLERFKNGEQSSGVVVEVLCLVKLLQNYVRFCKMINYHIFRWIFHKTLVLHSHLTHDRYTCDLDRGDPWIWWSWKVQNGLYVRCKRNETVHSKYHSLVRWLLELRLSKFIKLYICRSHLQSLKHHVLQMGLAGDRARKCFIMFY